MAKSKERSNKRSKDRRPLSYGQAGNTYKVERLLARQVYGKKDW